MDSRRATVRNRRSKCRCSCVLQFTFRRAVSCVLHRPPSQVIHCTVLFLFPYGCPNRIGSIERTEKATHHKSFSHPNVGKGSWFQLAVRRGGGSLSGLPRPDASRLRSRQGLDGPAGTWESVRPRAGEPGARDPPAELNRRETREVDCLFETRSLLRIDNDPSAGSPTETLLRLLLPLNAQVWESSQTH